MGKTYRGDYDDDHSNYSAFRNKKIKASKIKSGIIKRDPRDRKYPDEKEER